MISIRVQQLTKRFGEVCALRSLDLEIKPGELFFLLGPSGCGKTTLLRSLAGFYVPEEGHIFFGEDDVTRLEPHRRNTGMVFQSYALWPHMTVSENVAFGLRERTVPQAECARRVEEALRAVRMELYAERKPNQLSGGQQQRVALARALVVRPRCLLLDEPLSNLDAKLRLEMRSEIRRVCKEFQLTAVYVTHDQKEALSIADRMAVLDQGKILQIGTPQEVYRRPNCRVVANFIGETDLIEGRVTALDGDKATVETSVGSFVGHWGDPNHTGAVGSPVFLSIRPECWELRAEGAGGNCLQGQIGEAVYLGDVAQYEFKTRANALTVRIHERNPRHVSAMTTQDWNAVVAAEDVVLLTH